MNAIKRTVFLLFISIFFIHHSCLYSAEELFVNSLIETLQNYKRPVTLLEIAYDRPEYSRLALPGNVTRVVLLTTNYETKNDSTLSAKIDHRLTVLSPTKLRLSALETLAACEHFDVVIAKDLTILFPKSPRRLIDALKSLGDHVFIEAHNSHFQKELTLQKDMTMVARSSQAYLYNGSFAKKGLKMARFSQAGKFPEETLPYEIESTYRTKYLKKKTAHYPTPWIPGINLMTFVMLKGIYPTDAHIRKEIIRMQHLYKDHNDFVIGNMIVNGDRIVPIDFEDDRRKADFSLCVGAALAAFGVGNDRLENPIHWLQDYYACFE